MESNLSNGLRKRSDVRLSRNALPKRRGKRLSRNARWTLVGLSLSLLLLLFPPFWYGRLYPGAQLESRQWHFFLDSQIRMDDTGLRGNEGEVDLSMLFLEVLIGGVGIGSAWYASTSLQGP